MLIRILAGFAGTFFLILCTHTFAQSPDASAEMRRLQVLLAVINSEIRAGLDQVLALHEVIKSNARVSLNTLDRSPDLVNFDERAAAQRLANLRDAALSRRLDAILERSAELDAEKQPLLERVRSLGVIRPDPTASITGDSK
jgi:hypothetical protein